MSLNSSANSELSIFSAYVDRIIEGSNVNSNNESHLESLVDNSVEEATNKIIIDLLRTDFSKFSKVRGSLKEVILKAKDKPSRLLIWKRGRSSNAELVKS